MPSIYLPFGLMDNFSFLNGSRSVQLSLPFRTEGPFPQEAEKVWTGMHFLFYKVKLRWDNSAVKCIQVSDTTFCFCRHVVIITLLLCLNHPFTNIGSELFLQLLTYLNNNEEKKVRNWCSSNFIIFTGSPNYHIPCVPHFTACIPQTFLHNFTTITVYQH